MQRTSANIDWDRIETVFLDMDGTLLDLNFDNVFWQKHVPARYGELNALDADAAAALLAPRFAGQQGRLNWYCLDYWTRELGFDVAALKREYRHEIRLLPDTLMFLDRLRSVDARRVLLTNAHPATLAIKLECTGIDPHFDAIVSSHQFGLPKENAGFWDRLPESEPFAPATTLLVDDSLPVLRAARAAGIAHLRAIRRPDTQAPPREVDGFLAIDSVADLFPGENSAWD